MSAAEKVAVRPVRTLEEALWSAVYDQRENAGKAFASWLYAIHRGQISYAVMHMKICEEALEDATLLHGEYKRRTVRKERRVSR